MLFSVLFLMCAVDLSLAKNFNVICNNDTERQGMTFQPVGGEFLGRYIVELCTEVDPKYTEWETRISFYPKSTLCPSTISLTMKHQMRQHSRNVEYTKFNSNCTNVCLTKEFDLIFSGCYTVESRFLVGENGPRFKPYNFNVTSLFNQSMIEANTPTVDALNDDDNVTIIWHPGVPPTDYIVDMCDVQDKGIAEKEKCVNVSCSCPDWKTVKCVVRRPARCVQLTLAHRAPWTSGPFHPQEHAPYKLCPEGPRAVGVSGNNWTVSVWALGAGVAAALALLARRLWRSRRADHFKKLVQKTWIIVSQRNDRRSDAIADQIESVSSSRTILLVYARENVAGQRVVDALKTILEHYTDGQVLDVHSAVVCRLAAPAPAAWLRGVAARRDVSVLLLQTPAMHVLYSAGVQQHGPLTVSAPLFPARLARREPAFGDGLVQLALRLLTAPDLAHDYTRLHVADLSELPIELFPRVVPYVRYSLPRDVGLLARAAGRAPLAGPAPPSPPSPAPSGEEALITDVKDPAVTITPTLFGEEALIVAHREFVDMVKENPSYLMDDLMVIDEDTS